MKHLPPFEVLKDMSEEELEKLRKEHVEDLINSAHNEDQKRKLEGLQFKIDMERRRAKNPMDSCIRISKMMHESFVQLRDELQNLQKIKMNGLTSVPKEIQDTEESVKEEIQKAESKILPFNRKESADE